MGRTNGHYCVAIMREVTKALVQGGGHRTGRPRFIFVALFRVHYEPMSILLKTYLWDVPSHSEPLQNLHAFADGEKSLEAIGD